MAEWLTVEDIARELQVQERTVRLWLKDGLLPGIKMGRLWRIRRDELEQTLCQFKPTVTLSDQEQINLNTHLADVLERIEQLEADVPAQTLKSWKNKMAASVKKACYIPGRGIVLSDKAYDP